MKKCSRLCSEPGTRGWILQVARGLQATRRCTRVKHAEKLNCHASCSTIRQKVQTGHSVSSRLGLATQSSREAKWLIHYVMEKLTLRIPFSSSINIPYTHEILRVSRENFERKTLEKNKIDSSTIFSDSLNFSTLTLSIITSLRGTLAKTFSHHTHICEKAIWCLGSS